MGSRGNYGTISHRQQVFLFLRGLSSALCFAGRLALSWAAPNELSACQRLREPDLNEYVSSHEFVKTKARFPLCWVLHVSEKSCPLLRLNTTMSGRKEAKILPIMKGKKKTPREQSAPPMPHHISGD